MKASAIHRLSLWASLPWRDLFPREKEHHTKATMVTKAWEDIQTSN
jgi:hypothetical protein